MYLCLNKFVPHTWSHPLWVYGGAILLYYFLHRENNQCGCFFVEKRPPFRNTSIILWSLFRLRTQHMYVVRVWRYAGMCGLSESSLDIVIWSAEKDIAFYAFESHARSSKRVDIAFLMHIVVLGCPKWRKKCRIAFRYRYIHCNIYSLNSALCDLYLLFKRINRDVRYTTIKYVEIWGGLGVVDVILLFISMST